MALKLYDATQLAAALRAAAASFEAGRPDISGTTMDAVAEGFYAALDALGLAFDLGDWREENRDDKRT